VLADLMGGAFEPAMAGEVRHPHRQPYVVDVANPQRDLVDPAVRTREVLRAAAPPSVKRAHLRWRR
jgi:hypothetical protein